MYRLLHTRNFTLLAGFGAFALVAMAFAFQHILGEEPCILCVQQRVGFIVTGLFLIIAGGVVKGRLALLPLAIALVASVMGLSVAWELVDMHLNPSPFTMCSFDPNFWVPLDSWWPDMFEARASCTDAAPAILGVSMPMWSLIAFIGFTVVIPLQLIRVLLGK